MVLVVTFVYFWFAGELDPERMGSGIQYGDTSVRRMPKENTFGPSGNRPDCAC